MTRAWIVLALAAFALAGGCADTDIGTEYIEISEEESGLQFHGPGLAGGYRQFLTGRDDHFVRRTVASYGPKSGEFPFARIYFSKTPPDRYFARSLPVVDTIEQWFGEKRYEIGTKAEAVNAIGRVEFVTVTVEGVACVVWLQTFGQKDGTGVGTALLNGFYCRGQGSMMTTSEAERIVKLVGHREYGPVTPVLALLESASLQVQVTVIWSNDSSGVDRLEGQIQFSESGMDGVITIDAGTGPKCRGTVSRDSMEKDKLVMLWDLACAEGATARGSLTVKKVRGTTYLYLTGQGKDSKGRNVALIN